LASAFHHVCPLQLFSQQNEHMCSSSNGTPASRQSLLHGHKGWGVVLGMGQQLQPRLSSRRSMHSVSSF
jgi:hypothetical protein